MDRRIGAAQGIKYILLVGGLDFAQEVDMSY
jgi:hypothetical protein